MRAIGIALLVAWSLGPVLVGVTTSLETRKEAQQVPARWVPEEPNTDYYSALLGGEQASGGITDAAADASQFPRALLNTTLLTVASTVIVLRSRSSPATASAGWSSRAASSCSGRCSRR